MRALPLPKSMNNSGRRSVFGERCNNNDNNNNNSNNSNSSSSNNNNNDNNNYNNNNNRIITISLTTEEIFHKNVGNFFQKFI